MNSSSRKYGSRMLNLLVRLAQLEVVTSGSSVRSQQNLVSLILPSLRGGGTERAMVNLANALVRLGYDVDMVLVTSEGPYLSELDNRVHVVDLQCRKIRYALLPLLKYFRSLRPRMAFSAGEAINIVSVLAYRLARV